MRNDQKAYPMEFQRQMVDLVRVGRTPEELSREFKPSARAIWKWVRQAEDDQGSVSNGELGAERNELARLQREIMQLRQERDILRAVTWFARKKWICSSLSSGSQ